MHIYQGYGNHIPTNNTPCNTFLDPADNLTWTQTGPSFPIEINRKGRRGKVK